MRDLNAVIARHVAACVAEVKAEIEAEIRSAMQSLARAEKPVARAARKSTPTRGPKAKRSPSAKPAPSARTCGCGPVGRHRRECKLATGTGPRAKSKQPKSDDEDSGADRAAPAPRDRGPAGAAGAELGYTAPEQRRAPRRQAAERAAEELPVIPRAQLIARLRADRDVTGDAGGVVLLGGPSLVGHVDSLDRRETCDVHGWVGRKRFVDDGHASCSALLDGEQPCSKCRGRKFNQSMPCRWCRGTGIDRDIKTDNTPQDAAEGAGG